MPIYEYRCQACGIELEKLQKLSDPLLLECPECGRETLVKLVSASSFRLKGGGWYETDFKTGKKKNGVGEADNAGESAGKSADSVATNAGNDSTTGKAESGSGKSESTSGKGDSASGKGVAKEAVATSKSTATTGKGAGAS